MAQWSSFEGKVGVAFSAAVLVVATLAALTWKVADDAINAAQLVSHSHETLNNLARTRGYMLQVELTTQNFRLSGDQFHIDERNQAMAARERTLASIKLLTADNVVQQQRWTELRELTNQRMAISRQVEMLRKTQGAEAASAFVANAPLRITRARTYKLLSEMDAEERQQLSLRESAQASARKQQVIAGALVATLLAALLGATYLIIRRQLNETEISQLALADSEESLFTTLHSIGDAVVATDIDGRITRMNPVAEHLTGWPLATALGRQVEEVFHIINEQTREPAKVPVNEVLATGEMQGLADHTTLIGRDGTERPIADSAAPIRDASGQLRGVVLVFRDVTAERNTERIIRDQNSLLENHVRERTAQWRESEDHLRSVISAVPVLICYVNSAQHYVYVNQQYLACFAQGRADITGCSVKEILGDTRYTIASPMIDKALEGYAQDYDWQPFPDSWQTIRYIPKKNADCEVTGYYVLGIDITERKRAESRIQALNMELEQRVRDLEHASRALRTLSAGNRTMLRANEEQELLENMCQAIVTAGGYGMAVVWYPDHNEDKRMKPMAESGYPGGLSALRELNLTWNDSGSGQGVSATAVRTGQVQLIRNMKTEPNYPARPSNQLRAHTSGMAFPLLVGGEVIGALAIYDPEPDTFDAEEITLLTESSDDLAFGIATLRARAEQERIQASMLHMTRHDTLTGLPNIIQFEEAITSAIKVAETTNQLVSVLQFNIERLREINEALGFIHGDQILRDFGKRLRDNAPLPALVARLRGDEFAVLLQGGAQSALAFLSIVEESLAQPFEVADIALDVAAAIGITTFPEHGSTAQELLRRMDRAVHEAKNRGLRHVFFDPSQMGAQSERLTMAGELRHAIEDGDLRIYLQPKVAFASGEVSGAEALVRWQHPVRGLIPPGLFIELAERTGLIKPLTEWIIGAVLDILQTWQLQGCAMPIAVNLSARNLHEEDLLKKIRMGLREHDVATGLLEFEITESTLMKDTELTLQVLHALRAEGIQLYIDDFGTGYSSLSYLQKLPVNYIKIDQSFVADMSRNNDSAMIVRSTIDLVHDLGRKTVAEGIETKEHWDQLATLGCDFAQGYFIARPMASENFQTWVAAYKTSKTERPS